MTKDIFKKRQTRNRYRLATHGTRPRLSIFRSGKHIYAQVIDDAQAVTVASASTNEKDGKEAKIVERGGGLQRRQEDRRTHACQGHQAGRCSTVAATSIMGASRRSQTRPVKAGSSSKGS